MRFFKTIMQSLIPHRNNVIYGGYISEKKKIIPLLNGASLVAQLVKNLPAIQETRVHFLCWEDTLEKEMATHPSNFAWRIPWTQEPGGLQSMGSQETDKTILQSLIPHRKNVIYGDYISESKKKKTKLNSLSHYNEKH